MFNVPTEKKKYPFEIDSFKGVDFTSSTLDVDIRRSPNAKNIINNDGYIESRNGYQVLNAIGSKINGVWNIDTSDGDLFLVHSGTSLYQCSSDFLTSTLILSGMSNNRSMGVYFNEYLLIFDGVRTVVFSKFDGINYEAKFLDTCGTIPTTSVARNHLGEGTDYDKKNLISPYCINTFVSTKIEGELDSEGNPTYTDMSTFPLSDKDIVAIICVRKLNNQGEWENVVDYTSNLANGEVYFTPGDPPVTGRDNVEITYQYDNRNEKSKINKCKIVALYGYEGNDSRIFATGNYDFPNYDYWCESEKPLYWPDENFAKIGVQPIVGYLKLMDGKLAILKSQSDTDNTIYYRNYNLLNNIEVFPLKDGVKNIGCISSYANVNLLNDPLMLTSQGVFAVIGDNNEKFAMQRSFYVNGKLLKERNLENACSLYVDGKYYLAINNHIYIADSRYLSYPKNSKTEQYQYEWFYWDNIPARVLFSWNNKLYFGTSDGKICNFGTLYQDVSTNIQVLWETPVLSFNSNQLTKSIKNIVLVLNPKTAGDITFGYQLPEGEEIIVTKEYINLIDGFPKVIREKEKIKNFMFIKFFMRNATNKKMTFERLSLEYVYNGKFKGE